MKRFSRVLFVLMSVLLIMSFIGCSEEGVGDGSTTYTVSYDSQSATTPATPTSASVLDGETVASLPSAPVKTGYVFGGWFTEVSGGGTEFTTSTVVTADITVYARWDIPTYTVTYNGNGSTGGVVPTDSSSYTNGQEVTVLSNTGTLVKSQDGISLLLVGWNTQADGNGTDYALASGTFSMGSANVTLYAKWDSNVLRSTGPAGGLVFYDKGSYSDGWRYLEAAPVSTEWTSKVWGGYETGVSGADGTVIGTGEQNTTDITNAYGENEPYAGKADYAAKLCSDFTSGGQSDWFLPSKDELNKMYVNLQSGTDENSVVYSPVGGFANDYYWSSSEFNNNYTWIQSFSSGDQYYNNKGYTDRVRAVRAF